MFIGGRTMPDGVAGKTMVKHQLFVGGERGGFYAIFGHAWMERIVSEWIA